MIKLKYGNVILDIYDGYQITKSSQEVTFSDLTCDFTNRTIEELPEKYQEAKLVEIDKFGNEEVLFFGYVESYDFGEMRETDIDRDINITLLSPMKLATLRTVILAGSYSLQELIREVLQPLIDDGYVIEEMQVTNRTITVNYPLCTVEYCMNNLSNKFNFWWFIDEKKRIYIKEIETMVENKPNIIYDKENKIPYLLSIKPTISSEGYANVINFKNVRIYEYSELEMQSGVIGKAHNPLINSQIVSALKKDGQINFNYPCDIRKENIIKSCTSIGKTDEYLYPNIYGLYIKGTYSDNTQFEVYVRYEQKTGIYSMSSNVGFERK